ncbi:FAD binding domain-containing protein [Thermoflavimicrobium dichotomicum]|uniref:Carbon-monoxide dehydrogenase medium subunit/2-furoyl-CoA dehydrogenase FAD binding subunit n=1 Tax=Thermoflavimicrobium dichotomicum TaxID=46223 RepID=A0A1I3Q9S3_9BACL|nr:xanthine dehydrogenase family protein subunit M [Thermoflavimicrobium dichotomicum]SFJ30322.1 carbon-monoxide dehydrogenase medium subunit/2-furoyl-CoA dehydrogenase FAD binding subunit [Thermoflavimicrobium dichotomicum]
MYPAPISEYFAPSTLEECLDLLDQYGNQAKILAGGQSLIPLLKLRMADAPIIIDINRVIELQEFGEKFLESGNRVLRIGALTRHKTLASHPLVLSKYPIISDAAKYIGDVQIRNRGTIGGSLVHADPAADLPVPILVLDSTLRLVSKDGERTFSADEFFLGLMMTVIEPNEILAHIDIPSPQPGTGAAYYKYSAVFGDFAIISIGARITLQDGICQSSRIYLGGVNPRPQRAVETEEFLNGKTITSEILQKATDVMVEEVIVESDMRASDTFRKVLLKQYGFDVLSKAVQRAKEEQI